MAAMIPKIWLCILPVVCKTTDCVYAKRFKMSKTSTKAKMEYNRKAYRRYEFSVNIDSRLSYMIDDFMGDKNSLSSLVKSLLCDYFAIDDPSEIYVPYHFAHGSNCKAVVFENTNIKEEEGLEGR
jgi:hypothetical protein